MTSLASTESREVSKMQPLIRPARPSDFHAAQGLLSETSHLYPGIEQWWQGTVAPDLRASRRVAMVIEGGGSVGGLFIGKPGRRAKVCTLRLQHHLRDGGLGTLLMAEGTRHLVSRDTEEVYVTVSEAAEPGCTQFFETMGFTRSATERDRYVRGVDEFVYSCPAQGLREHLQDIAEQRAARTLFGLVPRDDARSQAVLMSIRPEFAEAMIKGTKTVEFRRRFSKRHAGAKVWFYASRPIQSILLTARISHVHHDGPATLWANHKERAGISEETFAGYFSGARSGFALSLERLRPLTDPIPLDRVRQICPDFRPPQAFRVMDQGSSLVSALARLAPEGGKADGHRHPFP